MILRRRLIIQLQKYDRLKYIYSLREIVVRGEETYSIDINSLRDSNIRTPELPINNLTNQPLNQSTNQQINQLTK